MDKFSKLFLWFFAIWLLPGQVNFALGQQVIKIGLIGITPEIPIHVAKDRGCFNQEGIKIVPVRVRGGAAAIPALAGGSLQMTHSAYVSAFVARERGIRVTILAPFDKFIKGHDASAIVVRDDSGIKKARDLEGKTVAVNVIKSLNWLYATEWLSKAGADPGKVVWLEVPFPFMIGAVRTKKVDAVYATEPFVTLEREKGGVRVVARPFTAVSPVMYTGGVVGIEEWVRPNKDKVAGFVRCLRKSIDYLNANRDKWPDIFPRYTRLKREWVPRLVKPNFSSDPMDLGILQSGADLALKWGLIRKRLDVKEMTWPTALAK
ncbi:MAG: ABC transporter substrate-binding protein [Thermodesulfobacteriota bacterium]